MFSKTITSSARFLKMPQEAQNLYFHLCMNADDDGVVEAFTIMQMLGSSEDVIKILFLKSFVRPLNEDMVSFITDWSEHNLIRADRKVNSIYKELLLQMLPEIELKEPRPRADTGVIPRQITTGRPLDGIGKDRVGEDRVGEDTPSRGGGGTVCFFDEFWQDYPPRRKQDKEKCRKKFLTFKETLQKEIVADVKERKEGDDWKKEDGKYVPAPIVYLNNRRWEVAIFKEEAVKFTSFIKK